MTCSPELSSYTLLWIGQYTPLTPLSPPDCLVQSMVPPGDPAASDSKFEDGSKDKEGQQTWKCDISSVMHLVSMQYKSLLTSHSNDLKGWPVCVNSWCGMAFEA